MLFFQKHRFESPANQHGDESAASSAALATDDEQAAASTAADDQSADPSTAEDTSTEEQSFFDAINDAANPKDEEAGDTEGEKDKTPDSETDEDTTDEEKDADGKTAEEDAEGEGEKALEREEDVPFHEHPRWKEVIRERNEYRDQLKESQPSAQQYQKIEQFMEAESLSAQDVAQGFQIMALMKNDPAKALEQLRGHIDNLEGFVGEKLPEDLQREVDEGYVTSDRARETARLRNQSKFDADRAAEQQRKRDQETQQRQVAEVQTRQKEAVDSWQEKVTGRDPDFKKKQPLVFRELALLAQREPPRSAEEAVALAEKALRTVNDQIRAFAPRKPEIKPSMNSDRAGANTAAAPQPDSFMEAVMQAAESTR